MNALLNNMLVYTRVNDEEYQLKREEISLEQLAQKIYEHYQPQMEAKGISPEWNKEGEGLISGDAVLIEMVMDNLLSNAVRYCKEKGLIRLTIRDGALSVYNDGEIISDEDMEHIWEPLYRSDAARTEEYGSSGMGLAISGAILKMHHADYGVENRDGGPEFYFRIP
ncbi:MAG: HAMP domain-containing histidine kinase [Clostridiales bacterium]|nr:HAMP domain-containing histidine kinase [Clostridiales bacterium]